jgi:REP element-mobilizing transposase RayT
VSHGRRERFSRHHPVHVTLRVGEGLGSLRRFKSLRVLRRALLACGQEGPFRVVHFNLLSNHLHLLVEAESAGALGKGMQRLAVRLARGWNRLCGRKGRVFADRYHARVIRTPRQARNTLVYVLCNARHHLSHRKGAAERGERLDRGWVDPWSSGVWFDGWRRPPDGREPQVRELLAEGRVTPEPASWLLRAGWRRHGAIDLAEVPGGR